MKTVALCLLLAALCAVGACDPASHRADWMRDARLGAFMHFLPGDAAGLERVRDFDVDALADQLSGMGVRYFVLTLGQNSGFFNAPNSAYDRLTGRHPGERCATRDLPRDLSNALRRRHIRLMLYLPCQPPNRDPEAQRAFGLPQGPDDQPLTTAVAQRWAQVIQEWSRRYGSRVSGWWFDGAYQHVRFNEEIAGIYARAARSGNPSTAVAFNPGVTLIRHSQSDDYTAGETNEPLTLLPASGQVDGAQWHALTFLGRQWGARDTRFAAAQWAEWAAAATRAGGAVTLDMGPNYDPSAGPIGSLAAAQVEQVKAIAAAVFGKGQPAAQKERGTLPVYIGTYTGASSKGIYRLDLDLATGRLENLRLAAATPQPSFLALSADGRRLYAVNENGDFQGRKSGSVTAFAVDASSGALTELNRVASEGLWPCHVALAAGGKALVVANYGGPVTSYPIGADGRLGAAAAVISHQGSGPNKGRQEGPHIHSANPAPGGRFVIVADLGIDKLMVYRLDPATGALTPHTPAHAAAPAGAGPRHLAFSPDGRFAYCANELTSTVTVYTWDGARGTLRERQTVTMLPAGFQGENTAAEVAVHPSGHYLYASNRGHNSIALFSIDHATGELTLIGHQPAGGKTPRSFAIDPSGRWLLAATQDSDNLVSFAIDSKTGQLHPTGSQVHVGKPVCVLMPAR